MRHLFICGFVITPVNDCIRTILHLFVHYDSVSLRGVIDTMSCVRNPSERALQVLALESQVSFAADGPTNGLVIQTYMICTPSDIKCGKHTT